MDFDDDSRCDLIKLFIKNEDSAQRVVSGSIRGNVRLTWNDEEEYLGGESILDIMACDYTHWHFKESEDEDIDFVVESELDEDPLVELAKTHPESHVRMAAISHIQDNTVLCSIIKNDPEKIVKKACISRLEELFID